MNLNNFLHRHNKHDKRLGAGSRQINMDITNKCTLACETCERQWRLKKHSGKMPGGTLALKDFVKYFDFFDHFDFCGQVSDPSMHPQFKEIIQLINENNKSCDIHNAASHRPEKWYREIFEECSKSNDMIQWYFGIDGLPKDSHKYRIRQDGEKLYRMMKIATQYIKPTNIKWKYIVFNYNQYDIEECKQMAADLGIVFNLVMSRRHPSGLRPDDEFTATVPMDNTMYYPTGKTKRWNTQWHKK